MAGGLVSTRAPGERGFTIVEVLVAVLLTGLGLLAVAPLFLYATRSSASSQDLGSVGARAVQRMETLRGRSFAGLPQGGSLTTDAAGFSDTTDPKLLVRWTIVDDAAPARTKTITVLARATRTVVGRPKEIQITTLRTR